MAQIDVMRSNSTLGGGITSLPALPRSRTIYEGKFVDRNPTIISAGKLTAAGEQSVEQCMRLPQRPPTPDTVKRMRDTVRPDYGRPYIFFAKANDPHRMWAQEMRHGLVSCKDQEAKDTLNPPPKTNFQQKQFERNESIYLTNKRAPLGTNTNDPAALPANLDKYATTFGVKTEKDCCAGELVNPPKGPLQIEAETEAEHPLYRYTHTDFYAGEQHRRNYTSPNYKQLDVFGTPTPHDNSGRNMWRNIHWHYEDRSEKITPIASKRLEYFRERTQPQLGKVLDPIKDTMHVASDHTFGIMLKPDQYGAGDLLHGRVPMNFQRGKDHIRGTIAAMRQQLKKQNYQNFSDLLQAFKFYDKECKGKITLENLREVCQQFGLPTEPELTEQLMNYCDVDRDGLIDYVEFTNFLNWREAMPNRAVQSAPASANSTDVPRIPNQLDHSVVSGKTSNSMINAVTGKVPTTGWRTFGIPSTRNDLCAPRFRRVADNTNYGDECDAYGLINPSIYTTHGVYEKDFLKPRSKDEIRQIFTRLGVAMDESSFDKIYELAATHHPKGHVSVESFRSILDRSQALAAEQMFTN